VINRSRRLMKVIRRDPQKGYLDTLLWVPKAHCNVEGVKSALTFQFFEEKEVRLLTLWRETAHHLLVPREFWDPTTAGFTFPVLDCRQKNYERVDIRSKIKLDHVLEGGKLIPTGDTVQRDSLQAMLQSRGGILQLACGKGKTVVALALAAALQIPTLVVVDTTQLVDQWQKAISDFLDVPGGVGMMGDGQFDWHKPIVIATYHTLARMAATLPEEVRRWFGLIIWDEAHHVAAPTFARSADLFSGRRFGLTATPTRADGLHVVYNFHIGKVVYKNLTQELKPHIYFRWTGLSLDKNDVLVQNATRDKNGELHLNKIATHFGKWKTRLELIISEVRMAVEQGRKVLVLSKSIDETVNLHAMWTARPELYTDIPYPTAQEVGETIPPCELEDKEKNALIKSIAVTRTQLHDKTMNPVKRQVLKQKIVNIEYRLEQGRVWEKTEKLLRFRQREYLKDLLADPSTGGLMIHKIPVKQRTELLRSKQVTFAIMKYGREGLDEKSLDTVIVCEPLSDAGALQQLMGRVQRKKEGKKSPVVVFIEDDIKPLIAMCQKLRQHLREWPIEDGGPFEFELVGHPSATNRRRPWTNASNGKSA
jgi:superfamily II DNA or RNA helicase